MHRISQSVISLLILTFLFSSCDKNGGNDNTLDPSNLTVEVMSVDHESGKVVIQASAQNAVEYQLFIGESDNPVQVNETGFFEYTFQGVGQYSITVRAYGASGRYIKSSRMITIEEEDPDPVPLDKGYFTPAEYAGYTLVWQDEFTGNNINSSNWSFEIGDGCPNNCGWGNNELEYYRAENAWVAEDVLTIEARKETYMSRSYTSARMVTRDKQSFRYGRVDIRALLPKGKGMWPALWMLGNDFSTVGWPRCGEIDIMEMVGGDPGDKQCHGTIHWHDGQIHASYSGSYTLPNETFADAYHVFSIIWDATSIKWYMNDLQYHQVSISNPEMSEFHQEFWFIFNVAVGGTWPGNPVASTKFPQQMKVDYIRVFQRD